MKIVKLYHKEVFMPPIRNSNTVTLKYGHHALKAANSDRYGLIKLPKTARLTQENVIELETINDIPTKAVIRVSHDDKTDLILVINPDGFVRTVWLNLKSDLHKTLDKSRYIKAA